MTTTRVLRTAAATLERTFYQGETPADSSTSVTVTVVDANGASVTSGTATSAGAGTGRYTFTLPAQSQLAVLTVTWAATIGGSAVSVADTVDIVSGFYFTLAEGRGSDSSLADTTKYTLADLATARQEAEEECERICQRAFVPRYRRLVLDGTGTTDLLLPDGGDDLRAGIVLRGVRTIRSSTVAPRVGETFVALTASELAALAVTGDGQLRRTDGRTWTEGVSNVVVEYEYGSDAPPPDLKRAVLQRFRNRLNIPRTGIPDRASSFVMAEGGTYQLDMPGAEKTGLPEVDAVYARYSRRGTSGRDGGRPQPASRPLNMDPQYHSLFHGGVR